MAVYIDMLFYTKPSKKWPYKKACHLMADDLSELLDFAKELGLKESWLQDKPMPHFDITENKRKLAKQKGALEINGHGVAKLLDRWR